MGNINLKTFLHPEEHEPLLTNHACPEMTVNSAASGYITKSQLILQFNFHSIGDKWTYTIHDYFHHNKRIFDAMHAEHNLVFIVDSDNHIVVILERAKWNTVVIKNSHKMAIAALVPEGDHFELRRMYKESGMETDEVDKPYVYSIEGDFEHNHYVIKNLDQEVISKISSIYGNQAMDQNFGVRLCKNTDVVMVISICIALNMFTNNVDEFANNMPALTPIGMPFV